MLALMIISVACFFALFFAVVGLLRRATRQGRHSPAATVAERRPDRAAARRKQRAVPLDLPTESYAAKLPQLPSKRPDWRFLVRNSRKRLNLRRIPSTAAETKPLAGTPAELPANPGSTVKLRSDWAFYNKDLGDLNDPYQATPPAVRRA